MKKYMQSGRDRMDESLSARHGKKSQSFKDRRDESYAMHERDMRKDRGDMRERSRGDFGHDKSPYYVNAYAAEKDDLGRVKWRPMEYRGTPRQAFDYEY